jgi:hypothetical protein
VAAPRNRRNRRVRGCSTSARLGDTGGSRGPPGPPLAVEGEPTGFVEACKASSRAKRCVASITFPVGARTFSTKRAGLGRPAARGSAAIAPFGSHRTPKTTAEHRIWCRTFICDPPTRCRSRREQRHARQSRTSRISARSTAQSMGAVEIQPSGHRACEVLDLPSDSGDDHLAALTGPAPGAASRCGPTSTRAPSRAVCGIRSELPLNRRSYPAIRRTNRLRAKYPSFGDHLRQLPSHPKRPLTHVL